MQPLFIGRDIGSCAASDWETYIRAVADQSDLFAVLDTHPGEFVKLHPSKEQVTHREMETLLRYYRRFLAKEVVRRWLHGESRFVVYEAMKRFVLSLPFATERYAESVLLLAHAQLKKPAKKQTETKAEKPEIHPVVTKLQQLLADDFPPEVLVEQLQHLTTKYGGHK